MLAPIEFASLVHEFGSLSELQASPGFTVHEFGSLSEPQRVAAVVLDQRLVADLPGFLKHSSVIDLPGIAAQAQCDSRRISDCCMV